MTSLLVASVGATMVTVELERLVRALADDHADVPGWTVEQMQGGFNSLIYRCSSGLVEGAVAVKFSRRDERQRSRREAAAQRIMAEHCPGHAPVLLHELDGGQRTAVVSTWLDGPVDAAPPTDDDQWSFLIEHLAAVHTVDATDGRLLPSPLDGNGSDAFITRLADEAARSPGSPDVALVGRAITMLERSGREPIMPRLVRCDPSLRNFIRRPEGWASVDWENSGASDPCFDVADLLCHPEYLELTQDRRVWIIEQYTERSSIPGAASRISIYCAAFLAWWVFRMQRLIREVGDGTDQRLNAWPEGFLEAKTEELDRYRLLADTALAP